VEPVTTVKIDIPDQQAAALKMKASAQGLTLEEWLQRMASYSSGQPAGGAIDWSQCPAVESISGKVGGAWIFKGTRTPVSIVFENLQDGMTIGDLMEQYPITREQIQVVLEFAAHSVAAPAVAAP
jgi:uncharacterized protein (DUF433 family)